MSIIEYTVYETTSNNPAKALKVRRPVANYTDYAQMIDHWFEDFLAGTHTFMKVQRDN
jgi:hypothetical protein